MRKHTLASAVQRIYANTKPEGGCLVTTGARYPSGYGIQTYHGKPFGAHVLVARHYLGPRPPGHHVRHICGRGSAGCVTASHLCYGTPKQNAEDKSRKMGTFERREREAMRARAKRRADAEAYVWGYLPSVEALMSIESRLTAAQAEVHRWKLDKAQRIRAAVEEYGSQAAVGRMLSPQITRQAVGQWLDWLAREEARNAS